MELCYVASSNNCGPKSNLRMKEMQPRLLNILESVELLTPNKQTNGSQKQLQLHNRSVKQTAADVIFTQNMNQCKQNESKWN